MILLPLFFLIYFLAWVGLVVGVGVMSWRSSKSVIGTGVAVGIAFLIMYWPAFGDYFPTVNAHREYCEKEAGFKIYVTPEQWDAENPGVLETLTPTADSSADEEYMDFGNKRFAMKLKVSSLNGAAIRKEVESIVDIKTKKILAENINFSSGYWYKQPQDWRSIKIWLDSRSCFSPHEAEIGFSQRKEYFRKLNTKWGYWL
jgi:hypothetical protein